MTFGGRRTAGKLAIAIAVIACLLAVWTVAAAGGASAQQTSAVTVDPPTGLADGQVLTVSWSGYPASTSVVVRQCAGSPTRATDCSTLLQSEPTDALGSGSGTFPVVLTASDRPLRGATNVKCDDLHACTIGVFLEEDPSNFSTASFAPISFAKPSSGCPNPGARSISAEGSDAVSQALKIWQASLCEKPDLTSVDYVPKNDPSGRQDFLCALRDLAVTQRGPVANEKCNGSGKGRAVPKIAPLSASALGFGYNLRDQKTGKRILDLKLSPKLLAMVFTGQILRWNDPRITALNPGYNLPTKMRVVGRADASDLNRQLTEFFVSTAKDAYEAGGAAFKDGVTDTYPSIPGVDLRTGGPAVGQAMSFPSENDPRDDPSYGYIGVLDSSAASFWGLPMAAIENADGTGFVAPTGDAISRGVAAMTLDSSGILVPNPKPIDQGAYRLPVLTYALLPTDKITADQRDAINRFVGYATGLGQSIGILPRGYVTLPEPLRAQAVSAAMAIPIPARPKPTATPTPTPTASASASTPATTGAGTVGDSTGSLGGGSGVSGDGGLGSSDSSAAGANSSDVPAGTAAVAAGVPATVTSVFARTGQDKPGPSPYVLPLLIAIAAGGFLTGQQLLSPKKSCNDAKGLSA